MPCQGGLWVESWVVVASVARPAARWRPHLCLPQRSHFCGPTIDDNGRQQRARNRLEGRFGGVGGVREGSPVRQVERVGHR
jgi:hypothetical protein